MPSISGSTDVVDSLTPADLVHQVRVGAVTYSARYLARLHCPGPLAGAAHARVLRCLGCGGLCSARELYGPSTTGGTCLACTQGRTAQAS